MKSIFTLLFLCSLQAFGQKIHLPHEVEKGAEPAGGVAYFNQFIDANLQLPFQSAAKGLNKRIFIKGIVEPDGTMTNLELVRGIDSLCDQEALRVAKLFRAWKPALVKGEPVRQSVSYPIQFKSPARSNYDSTSGAVVEYYDHKYVPLKDPAKAEYRTTLPIDRNGYVAGDVKYEEKRGNNWKSVGTVAFAKNNVWFKSDYLGVDSVQAYSLSARDKNMTSHASEATFQQNGRLLEYTEYGANNKAAMQKLYDLNGMVREMKLYSDSLKTEIRWYDNGQIRSVVETIAGKQNEAEQIFYVNAWNTDGKQVVKDGDGYWKATSKSYDGNWLTEEGKVISGVKNGKWTGKLADSTLHYTEEYEVGVLQNGTSFYNGEKKEYTQAQVNPQFKGGLNEMYRFLASNIRYPVEASRRGASGRVQLSFVVCEDGSLCEYKVEKSAGSGLDEEALRVVKKMNGSWEPGVLRGKPVRVRYNMPINFQTM
jgi:TonB family protein